jgi:pilus assembly protein CpaC
MKRYLLGLFAIALAAALPALAAAGAPDRLNMFVGDTRIVPIESERIAIGNGQIVSVSSLGPGQLLFLAATPGVTTVNLVLPSGGERNITVAVTEANMELALENVNKLLQGTQNIRSRIAGNKIVLEGDRVDDADQQRAASIVESYGGLVLNFIGKVGFEQMIYFAVKIVEVRRSAVRQLGIRWDASVNGPSVGTIADIASNNLFRVAPPPDVQNQLQLLADLPRRVAPTATYAGITSVLNSRIDLLEQKGLANIISEPTLSCRSGGSARFVAGGEIPIPVQTALGQTNVEFKEFGVILDVKPVADRSGTISAQIDTEVSQLDPTVTVLGVPGFIKRRSTTEVNMRDGETIAIAGLVDRSRSQDRQQVPVLGSIPIIGSAFRTKGTREAETELLILLSPRIVTAEYRPGLFAADPAREALDRATDLINSPEAPRRMIPPVQAPVTAPPSAAPAQPPVPATSQPQAQVFDPAMSEREQAREQARLRRAERERREIERATRMGAKVYVNEGNQWRLQDAR